MSSKNLQQQRQTLETVEDFACESKFLHFSFFFHHFYPFFFFHHFSSFFRFFHVIHFFIFSFFPFLLIFIFNFFIFFIFLNVS